MRNRVDYFSVANAQVHDSCVKSVRRVDGRLFNVFLAAFSCVFIVILQ